MGYKGVTQPQMTMAALLAGAKNLKKNNRSHSFSKARYISVLLI